MSPDGFFKSRLRRAVLFSFARLGRIVPLRGGRILTYHSVDDSGSPISLSPDVFDAQMSYLHARGFSCVGLSAYLRAFEADPSCGNRLICLTFDDGYTNFLEAAMPVLLSFGFSATVFVVSGYAGRRCTWEKMNSIPDLPLMTWQDIHDCLDNGIEVGSHSVSHAHLDRLGANELRAEIYDSKAQLEDKLGRRTETFCYPYGDTHDRVRAAVREAGYDAAVTTRFGHYYKGGDRFDLPRLGMNRIHPDDKAAQRLHVEAAAAGTLPLYHLAKGLFARSDNPGPGSRGGRK